MKIVKKLKGIISWHFYKDEEMLETIRQITEAAQGISTEPIKVITNLFKGTDGDEIGDLYVITGQDENRMYIDNEQKKLIINVKREDIASFVSYITSFLNDKKIATEEILRMMIGKKEYSLMGFNQQHKRFIRIAEKREKDARVARENAELNRKNKASNQ